MWISLFQTTEWSSPSLLSWMQCLIQATCSLMLENNHEILHLLYGKLGKAIWAIWLYTRTAVHVTAEMTVCHVKCYLSYRFVSTHARLPGCFCNPSLRAIRNSCKSEGIKLWKGARVQIQSKLHLPFPACISVSPSISHELYSTTAHWSCFCWIERRHGT